MITPISMEEFRAFQGVSYSRLSKLAGGPQAYKTSLEEDSSSSALALGAAVDILLTEPDRFDEEIYVMSAEKPGSDMMFDFATVYAQTDDKEKAWKASGFKISADRVMKKFDEEGKNYYDALKAAKNRKILDVEELFKANQIVNTVKTNQFTKKYFVPEKGTELLFQVPVTWSFSIDILPERKESKLINAKSLLDIILIDHNKKIIQPIEFKTGAEFFFKSFWKWKRYLQASMYHDAAIALFWAEQPIAEEYEIKNIKFIYADTNLINPPLIYNMTDADILGGRMGRKVKFTVSENGSLLHEEAEFKTKGYIQLAEELYWHQTTNQWDYSYDIFQNNGEVDIDAFIVKL
jgi:hypothetical protein